MLICFITGLVISLVAAHVGIDVRQPASVQPLESSKTDLFASEDLFCKQYNGVEHNWRIAREQVTAEANARAELRRAAVDPAQTSPATPTTTRSPARPIVVPAQERLK